MPSRPKPKTFVAVRDFSCAGERYTAGDEVPPGPALTVARTHGDAFVTSRPAKSTQPNPKETP